MANVRLTVEHVLHMSRAMMFSMTTNRAPPAAHTPQRQAGAASCSAIDSGDYAVCSRIISRCFSGHGRHVRFSLRLRENCARVRCGNGHFFAVGRCSRTRIYADTHAYPSKYCSNYFCQNVSMHVANTRLASATH